MIDYRRWKSSRGAMAAGAAVLVALGAAGGAGAVQATRPAVEMAPTVPTPIARLAATDGLVTVKGRVAEVYGDRFVVQDTTGRAMIAAGSAARDAVSVGQPVLVQGRFDDGQLRASYLVDRNGNIAAVGPRGLEPGGSDGPGGRGAVNRSRHDGPPPPPPPGCAPAPAPGGPEEPGAVPPPPRAPENGVAPPSASVSTPPPPNTAPPTAAGQVPLSGAPTRPQD